mmetsp:Transcript_44552/g.93489  ORF Transcript_44552/g.93489 Transcript_44552/m.93489 type:complete len:536 (+) Transcript_44552:114-1721(+)
MVKFGRHLQFYLESDEQSSGIEPFIVPYTDIRDNIGHSQDEFSRAWQASLETASNDYTDRTRLLWKQIFSDLFRSSNFEQEHRGLPHEEAIELYVSAMDEGRSRDLLTAIKKIHTSASMNAEALRKLVKKFDKGAVARGDELLTSTLIPELYSAPFMAYPTLEAHIETLRDSLVVAEEEEELDEDSVMYSIRKKTILSTKDSADVKRRADEMSWLHDMLANGIPGSIIPSLVAHRGFHCPRDYSGKRPLENSLSSFESAWSAGIHLCECDVALTKDEKLVLAHDEDFSRLALDPSKDCSTKKVGDLTMKEIISLTFKSGTRPPLLLDVLRSAQAIGGFARLVVEIKPGNQEACTALIRLFRQHPELIERCAVIMSFDAYTMHKLRSGLDDLASELMAGCVPIRRSDSPDNVCSIEEAGSSSTQIKLPEVILLTVADEPQQHYELCVGVSDFSPVHSWLQHEGKPSLNGVYLQYQPEMLQPNGIAALRALSNQYRVGVWGYFGDPDNIATASSLVRDSGVSFVNTDLPRNFNSMYR